jgi:hypothetical protein
VLEGAPQLCLGTSRQMWYVCHGRVGIRLVKRFQGLVRQLCLGGLGAFV